MKRHSKWRKILGVAFLVLGFFGLFLPILQGILFILIGLVLLGFGPAKKLLKKFRNKKAKSLYKAAYP